MMTETQAIEILKTLVPDGEVSSDQQVVEAFKTLAKKYGTLGAIISSAADNNGENGK